MISGFIENQASSGDHCSARLLEAKHQMNSLHVMVHDVTFEMSSSESVINTTTKEINEATHILGELDKTCNECDDECDKNWKEVKETWKILKWELKEMYMIANPKAYMAEADVWAAAEQSIEVSSTSSTGIYSSTGGHISSTSTTSGNFDPESSTGYGSSGWTLSTSSS